MEASELISLLQEYPEYMVFIRSDTANEFEAVKEITINEDREHLTIWG